MRSKPPQVRAPPVARARDNRASSRSEIEERYEPPKRRRRQVEAQKTRCLDLLASYGALAVDLFPSGPLLLATVGFVRGALEAHVHVLVMAVGVSHEREL